MKGKRCSVLLDSGCNGNVIHLSLAKKLGIVTGKEKKVTIPYELWDSPRDLEIIKV